MKKIILSAAFVAALGSVSIVKAQTTPSTTTPATTTPAPGTTTSPATTPGTPATTDQSTTAPATTAPATTTTAPATTTESVATAQEVSKTEVKLTDLPEAVTKTLKSAPVSEWTPTDASLVKTSAGEFYLVNLKKGTDARFVRLDKDGRPVK
ncbi:hypothetical protein GCM10023149_04830 [Mucilaginibacter gynuensis]|uniref:Uncharacterized protein n=1 Tax=Mucilaginibacter gynuensis TaxID=1302236 RepID=A0ABP8FSV8_9SPHI